MESKNLLLRAGIGKKTILDKAYNKHIIYVLDSFDEETEDRWEVYNLIIMELINQGKKDCFKELQYRITDGEDPNKIILNIIERESNEMGTLTWYLYKRIKDFIEEDFFKKFFI